MSRVITSRYVFPSRPLLISLFQEKYILVEFKHIARFIPPGIYVLPSFDTLNCTFVVPLRRR